MGYFGSSGVIAATEIVAISGGYHVTIGLLSGKDEAECNAILNPGKQHKTKVIGSGANAQQETEVTMDYAAYRDARLLRGIKSWNLDDDKGEVVPVTLANIQAMPERDRNTIFVALDKFNAPLDDVSLGE
jgi:hypothetical protein